MTDKIILSVIKRNLKILKTQEGLFFRFKRKLKKNGEFKNALKIISSGYFDYEYYLINHPDIAIGNPSIIEAAIHYNMHGWEDGKNPSELFDNKIFIKYNNYFKGDKKNLLLNVLKKEENFFNHNIAFFLNEDIKEEYDCSGQTLKDFLYDKRLSRMYDKDIPIDISKKILELKYQPKISIIIPVYNTEIKFLKKCIDSVVSQSYENWQICLADDCSSDEEIHEVLSMYCKKDARINVVFREENGHISHASNSALELAEGEWTALLDHDDELHVNALYFTVEAINMNPNVEFIYTDEDKIDEKGKRYEPHFKSDWNLDLLYSQNYISHLGVYKTNILKKIKGFRVGLEGSQDYDLLLRYSKEIAHSNIVHIPRVLYHWRAIKGSTALNAEEKSYTTDAGIKALKNYFFNIDSKITVERGKAENIYKVNWPIKNNPLVSLIIPTYNGYEITKQAIDSILEKTAYKNYEILLIDNNSDDKEALDYFEKLNNHPKITVLKYSKPFNYSAINNFAVQHAKGEVLGLVNNDIEVINPEWLDEMLQHALREDIGCVGAMLYYPDNTIQHAGVIIGVGGVANHSHLNFKRGHPGYFRKLEVVQNFSAVTAACLLVRKEVFNEVKGLNDIDLKIAFNDVDLCLKVQKAGYRNLWTPYAELYHYESISRGVEDTPEKLKRFTGEVNYMKNIWKTHVLEDPYYSSNLTKDKADFSINMKRE